MPASLDGAAAAPACSGCGVRGFGGIRLRRAPGLHELLRQLDRGERRLVDLDGELLPQLVLGSALLVLHLLLEERDPDRAFGLRELAPVPAGEPVQADDEEPSVGLDELLADRTHAADAKGGLADRLWDAGVCAALIAGRADDAELSGEIERRGRALVLRRGERVLEEELPPRAAAPGLLRLLEDLLPERSVADDDGGDAPALGLAELVGVRLVVRAHLGRGDVGRRRQALPSPGDHRLAEDLPDRVLDSGVLVEAPAPGFQREQLRVDDLAEQLAAPLLRLVPEPIELIHALQRPAEVAQGDHPVPDLREHARRLLGGEAEDRIPASEGTWRAGSSQLATSATSEMASRVGAPELGTLLARGLARFQRGSRSLRLVQAGASADASGSSRARSARTRAQSTIVPISSPLQTRRMLPRVMSLNTRMGILFSRQSVTAVESMTPILSARKRS